MKKVLSVILSILMAFSAFSVMPFNAFAQEKVIEWDASAQNYPNGQEITDIAFDSNISADIIGEGPSIASQYFTADNMLKKT